MKEFEKELNQLLYSLFAAILKGIQELLIGIWWGIRKLTKIKNLLLFFFTLIVPVITYCLFRPRIFVLPAPLYIRYLIYYFLLGFPLVYLFVTGKMQRSGKRNFDQAFQDIDFKGRDGLYPVFCGMEQEGKKTIYIFKSNIPLEDWRNKKALLETGLDCTILKIENGRTKKVVRITTISSDFTIPKLIRWEDSYIQSGNGVITVGQSALGEITFDLNRTPHVLAAGETGSGKSVILRMILWQFINQGSRVFMLDFKGGVEFGIDYERYGEVVTERKRALEIFSDLEQENTARLKLFREMRVKNIVEYNKKTKQNLCRIGVFCDELAEMMDKKGARKEEKELMEMIEGKISTLARLARATGINLIIGMQRPDANVLTGQIKNNIPIRISGRFSDKTASEIVLGNTDACNIPDIKGRFMYKVGNETEEFQSYYFDDETMLKDVYVEVGDMLSEGGTYKPTARAERSKRCDEPVPKSSDKKKKRQTFGMAKEKPTQEKRKEDETPTVDPEVEEWERKMAEMDDYDMNFNFDFEEVGHDVP